MLTFWFTPCNKNPPNQLDYILLYYHLLQDFGPPERVIPLGEMTHTCQEDLVMKVTQTDVPYFNAPIYLENKEQVRKVTYHISFNITYTFIDYVCEFELIGLQTAKSQGSQTQILVWI